MSQENVEIVRAMFEQFARGDYRSWDALSTEVEFVTSPDVPDAGTYRGEAALRWVRAWVGSFEGLTVEAREILDAGDKVLVEMLQRGRPRGSETVVEGRWWIVHTLRDGNLIRAAVFPERAQALAAVGLAG